MKKNPNTLRYKAIGKKMRKLAFLKWWLMIFRYQLPLIVGTAAH